MFRRCLPHPVVTSLLLAASMAAGCTGSPVDSPDQTNSDNTLAASDASSALELSVPPQLKRLRALDLEALYAIIVINGDTSRWTESTPLTRVVRIPEGEMLNLDISWFETQDDNTDLLLATYELEQQITDNLSINIDPNEYVTEGNQFDADSDGFSNLFERQNCSSPMVAASTPVNCPQVRIPWISPTDAPNIDGLYDQIWNNARFTDVNGEQLDIDNLMINQGAILPDGNTGFRWFAMHDDINLYIFVGGELVDSAMLHRDSTRIFQDDTVNIYIDGDHSNQTSYDGVDDRHILVPLLTSPEDPSSNSTVFVKGSNSVEIPAFEFATCLCTSGRHTWEFRLPLADFNITKNEPFGFEIQIDDDADGGARDARWGWFHPSRTDMDIDFTWQDPSYMGIAIIE